MNILDIVTVERCFVRVESEQQSGQQPHVRITHASWEGLRVNGHQVDVQFSMPFNEFPLFDDWRRFAFKEGLAEKWAVRKGTPAQGVSGDGDLIWAHLGVDLRKAQGFIPARIERNVINIPDFGSLHLGEILIARSYRRVSMLRFQLGSPVEGQIEVGTSKGGSLEI